MGAPLEGHDSTMTDDDVADLPATRALLEDSFDRIRQGVHDLTDGLSDAVACYRPDAEANPVGWLVWHLLRVEDGHVSELAGEQQAWTASGWHERSGLSLPPDATGYGHGSDEVAAVRVAPEVLDGYSDEVHRRTLRYVGALTAEELERVVDTSWDPPVTAAVRLVSVVDDCSQHLGQAALRRRPRSARRAALTPRRPSRTSPPPERRTAAVLSRSADCGRPVPSRQAREGRAASRRRTAGRRVARGGGASASSRDRGPWGRSGSG